jgi:dTDP-4-dehydrorhamnose 3,5-epimerase-like enzyme
VFLTTRPRYDDARGSFTKVLGEGDSGDQPPFLAVEMFWSSSPRGVFRGLHVPGPGRSSRKAVFVAHGRVRDFVLDLRRGSPTEGLLYEVDLDEAGGALIVAEGCAHGFEVVSDRAAMVYAQERHYDPGEDLGVLYSSAGVVLAAPDPVVSERDAALPALADFDSPFPFA